MGLWGWEQICSEPEDIQSTRSNTVPCRRWWFYSGGTEGAGKPCRAGWRNSFPLQKKAKKGKPQLRSVRKRRLHRGGLVRLGPTYTQERSQLGVSSAVLGWEKAAGHRPALGTHGCPELLLKVRGRDRAPPSQEEAPEARLVPQPLFLPLPSSQPHCCAAS